MKRKLWKEILIILGLIFVSVLCALGYLEQGYIF
jgi:hypothetical protein